MKKSIIIVGVIILVVFANMAIESIKLANDLKNKQDGIRLVWTR